MIVTTHADAQPSRLGLPAALIVFGAYFLAHLLYGPLTPDDAPRYVFTIFLTVLALGLLLAVHLLRAHRAVFLEPRRAAWPWGIPLAILVLLILVGLATSGGAMADLGALAVLGLAVRALMVGVTEELVFRGVVLQGLRGAKVPEWAVMVVTSVAFGAMHLLNLMAADDLAATLVQVVTASLFGGALYLARRVTGALLAPIALHAAWDFFTFVSEASEAPAIAAIGFIAFGLTGIVAVVLVLVERARGRTRARSTGLVAG